MLSCFCVTSYSNVSLFSCVSSPLPLLPTCVDPFTSAEAVDDSIPNLNPFLTKPVVDAAHLPVVSSDAVSFSSRTPSHEMFGGKRKRFLLLSLSLSSSHFPLSFCPSPCHRNKCRCPVSYCVGSSGSVVVYSLSCKPSCSLTLNVESVGFVSHYVFSCTSQVLLGNLWRSGCKSQPHSPLIRRIDMYSGYFSLS